MIRKKKGNLEWLEFELFAECSEISHAVFLRHGGCSQGQFNSLNFNRISGDQIENVMENKKKIIEEWPLKTLFSAHQIHGKEVLLVENENQELQCDGLMTQKKELGLLTLHADCQAALFYDPRHHAIATVHAGWRGQVQNIYHEVIHKMKTTFGTQPQDLLVGISPSLGPLNSEFKHYQTEFPPHFWPFQIKTNYFNLWAIARHQLESEGILRDHIEIAEIDTYAHPQDFFSYRRETALGKVTGSHGSMIVLH